MTLTVSVCGVLSLGIMMESEEGERDEVDNYIRIEHEERYSKHPRCTSVRIPSVPVFVEIGSEESEWDESVLEYDIDEDIV